MKIKIAIAFLFIACASFASDFIPRDPWRAIDGTTNYAKGSEWVQFAGKVLEVQSHGVRLEGNYNAIGSGATHYFTGINYEDYNYEFFVANFPYDVAEGDIISEDENFIARKTTTYTYETTAGGSRTIRQIDYGIPCDPPAPTPEQLAAIKAKQELDKKRAAQGQINAVKWLQSQATNGDASAQCSLGEHYLNGQGCETNKTLAIFWLQKAAAQGDSEASNRLVKINLVSTNSVASP